MTSATGNVPVMRWPVSSSSPGAERVAEAQLDRIDPAGRGQQVHLRLVRERHLHRTEAPHRAARRVVGPHAQRLDQRVRHSVRARREARRVGGDVERRRAVRAAVEHDARLEAHQRAVEVGTVPHPDPRRVTVHVPEERLAPGVHHLHRSPRAQREQARVDVQAHVLARTESTAHPAEGEAHEPLREPEAFGHLLTVVVQPLRRHDEVDAAVVGGDGEPGFGAHERLVLHPDLVLTLDDHKAARAGVAAPDEELAEDVPLGVERGSVDRGVGIRERFEHVVVDDDRVAGTPRRVRVVGRDGSNRFARVAHDVVREHGLVAMLEPVPVATTEVGGGEHRGDPGNGRARDRRRCRRCAPRGAASGGSGPRACRRPRGRRRTRTRRGPSAPRRGASPTRRHGRAVAA